MEQHITVREELATLKRNEERNFISTGGNFSADPERKVRINKTLFNTTCCSFLKLIDVVFLLLCYQLLRQDTPTPLNPFHFHKSPLKAHLRGHGPQSHHPPPPC